MYLYATGTRIPMRTQVDDILFQTMDSLKRLIDDALARHDFDDVSRAAIAAAGIKSFLDGRGNAPSGVSLEVDGYAAEQSGAAHGKAQYSGQQERLDGSKRASTSARFPRFERDDDRLVKVGWSKKDRKAYEHKSPRLAVDATALAISRVGKAKKVFTMDDVLPVPSADGGEVPSYQAYVVVAWLRDVGLVRKIGKNGYSLVKRNLDAKMIETTWQLIPSRAWVPPT